MSYGSIYRVQLVMSRVFTGSEPPMFTVDRPSAQIKGEELQDMLHITGWSCVWETRWDRQRNVGEWDWPNKPNYIWTATATMATAMTGTVNATTR